MAKPWRIAKSLDKLLGQLNEEFPNRDKSSDGGIGNAEHSARASDHNPDTDGVVKARDFTHDPKHGLDSEALANSLRLSQDPRIKYIISNSKIAAGAAGPSPWKWRKYTGSNPHNKHCHVSVVKTKGLYDSSKGWEIPRQASRKPVGAFNPPGAPGVPEEPKSLVKSKIAVGSATIATLAAGDTLATIAENASQAASIKNSADSIGVFDLLGQALSNPQVLVGLVIVIASLAVVYWRWRDYGRGRV